MRALEIDPDDGPRAPLALSRSSAGLNIGPPVDADFWSLALIIAAAHGVQVVIGFGGSILALTFASLVAPVETLLPLLVPLNLGVPLYLSLRYRRSIDRAELLRRIIPYTLAGLVLGFGLFLVIDGSSLTVVYAAFIIVLASLRLLTVARRGRRSTGAEPARAPPVANAIANADADEDAADKAATKPASERRPSRLWLVGGGLCHGLFATGGPVLILYTAVAVPDKQRFRCTMAALWVLLNSALVTGYALHGDLTPETLRTTASLAPALIVGVVVGEAIHRRISQETFTLLIYVLLLIAGGLLLARSLS